MINILQLMQEVDELMLLLKLGAGTEDGGLHPGLTLVDELILAAHLLEDHPDQVSVVVELPQRNDFLAEFEEDLRESLPFSDEGL